MGKINLVIAILALLILSGCGLVGNTVDFRLLVSDKLQGKMGPCG
jgi:hypothetical protein